MEKAYNDIKNKEFVTELGNYVNNWFTTLAGITAIPAQNCTWEQNVETVAKHAIKIAEAEGIDLMKSCLQVSCGMDCKEKCKESFITFVSKKLFATGELHKVLNLPTDEHAFENLYDWQEFSLHCLLKPFYEDVYEVAKKIQSKKA